MLGNVDIDGMSSGKWDSKWSEGGNFGEIGGKLRRFVIEGKKKKLFLKGEVNLWNFVKRLRCFFVLVFGEGWWFCVVRLLRVYLLKCFLGFSEC